MNLCDYYRTKQVKDLFEMVLKRISNKNSLSTSRSSLFNPLTESLFFNRSFNHSQIHLHQLQNPEKLSNHPLLNFTFVSQNLSFFPRPLRDYLPSFSQKLLGTELSRHQPFELLQEVHYHVPFWFLQVYLFRSLPADLEVRWLWLLDASLFPVAYDLGSSTFLDGELLGACGVD